MQIRRKITAKELQNYQIWFHDHWLPLFEPSFDGNDEYLMFNHILDRFDYSQFKYRKLLAPHDAVSVPFSELKSLDIMLAPDNELEPFPVIVQNKIWQPQFMTQDSPFDSTGTFYIIESI